MKFTIMVTEDCNLRCNYCYEGNNKSKKYMSRDIADKVIQFISNQVEVSCKNNDLICIVLHGGEPLLNFDLIKYIHKSLSSMFKHKKIVYDMTTNGTILNNEIEEFIDKNIDTISISIDGIKESHDKNRIFRDGLGSYDLVMDNVNRLLEKGIDIRARMTFNNHTVSTLYESVINLSKFNFKYIVPAIDNYDIWDDEGMSVLNREIDKLIEYKKDNNDSRISLMDINLLHRKKGDCFGGFKSFCIDTEGFIYPCTFSVLKKEFVIGDVKREYNYLYQEKLDKLFNVYTSKNEYCIGCTRYEYCTGTRCKIINKLITNSYTTPPRIICFKEHMNVNIISKLIEMT